MNDVDCFMPVLRDLDFVLLFLILKAWTLSLTKENVCTQIYSVRRSSNKWNAISFLILSGERTWIGLRIITHKYFFNCQIHILLKFITIFQKNLTRWYLKQHQSHFDTSIPCVPIPCLQETLHVVEDQLQKFKFCC